MAAPDTSNLGDLATWVGGIGTWAVGIIAGVIAYQQYRRDQFRPAVAAFCDSRSRVVVRIVNEGAGTGEVYDVNLLPPGHPREPVVEYLWEIDGKQDERILVPFTLPGRASAQLVLVPLRDLTGARVRVEYGHGRDSGCVRIRPVDWYLYGTTTLPGRSSTLP